MCFKWKNRSTRVTFTLGRTKTRRTTKNVSKFVKGQSVSQMRMTDLWSMMQRFTKRKNFTGVQKNLSLFLTSHKHASPDSECESKICMTQFVSWTAPFQLLVYKGSAWCNRDRRQCAYWRHEHLCMKMALVTEAHHSAYTNGVTETSVRLGLTGVNEAFSSVRANLTRGLADSCAKQITVLVVTTEKMIITTQSTRALTVSSKMYRRTSDTVMPQYHHSMDPSLLRFSAVPNKEPPYSRVNYGTKDSPKTRSGGNGRTFWGTKWMHEWNASEQNHEWQQNHPWQKWKWPPKTRDEPRWWRQDKPWCQFFHGGSCNHTPPS